ncbi:protein kinase [bacterium]|nr:protein kinase [bacterium]
MPSWQTHFPQLLKNMRYSVLRKIGEGGMAIVFQCKDRELDDMVALKILKPDLTDVGEMLRRFKQEIKIARRISHRNICRIYDFGTFEDLAYIVMEYLEGVPLSSVIRIHDAIPDDKKLTIAIRILEGLDAAHREDIAHRDLKPGNIMIIKNLEPVIMDFGLARDFGTKKITPADHSIYGTPAYMAPEQIVGKGANKLSDLYAFGLIFYELITNYYPFDDTNYFKLLYSHVNEKPASPRQIMPKLNQKLEKIIMKCLEKKPEDRYQSAGEVISEIMSTFTDKKDGSGGRQRKQILIVDDDQAVLNVFKRMFESFGLKVLASNTGEKAINIAMSEQLDLICLDIMMPGMSGLEVAEILLTNPITKSIPIVVITAKSDKEYMHYSRQLGILDYLTKPITRDDIETRLDYWLQQKHGAAWTN